MAGWLVGFGWLLAGYHTFAVGHSGYNGLENLINANGHGLCKRWWWSDKAVGVKNLDAI
jgi:hypothetical protein